MVEVQVNGAEALVNAISALRSIAHGLTIVDPRIEAKIALDRIGQLLRVEQIAEPNVVRIDFPRR